MLSFDQTSDVLFFFFLLEEGSVGCNEVLLQSRVVVVVKFCLASLFI